MKYYCKPGCIHAWLIKLAGCELYRDVDRNDADLIKPRTIMEAD